jgi:hypothetical protein
MRTFDQKEIKARPFPDRPIEERSDPQESDLIRLHLGEAKTASKKFGHLHPLKQIRKHCLACSGNRPIMVRYCLDPDCALWFLRFGRKPWCLIRAEGAKALDLFDPENFKPGGKFGPDKFTDTE